MEKPQKALGRGKSRKNFSSSVFSSVETDASPLSNATTDVSPLPRDNSYPECGYV